MMNDIPKNGTGSIPQQPQKIEQVKNSEISQEVSAAVQPNITQETTNLPNVDAAGRSLVSADNIENDLKFLKENPKAALAAFDYFDKAYSVLKAAGHQNPYEESCAQMGVCAKELT